MRTRIRRALGLVVALVVVIAAAGWWLVGMESVPEPDLPGVIEERRTAWEKRERTWRFYRPSQLAERPAVVFVLHGSMGDGRDARGMMAYEFDRLAEAHGFLAVYPDGFDRHWNGCRAHGPYEANALDVDDVGFLRAIVGELEGQFGVDPGRVFATGVSNGGHMAIRLALEAPDFVTAVAPIVASLPSGDNLDCEPTGEPVAVVLVNGSEDPMNPFEGGTVALYGLLGNRGTVHSTQASIEYFAANAGHEGEAEIEPLPDLRQDDGSVVVRHRWEEPGRPEVTLYAVMGGGHTVPHPRMRFPRLIGRTNADVNAAEEIWAFFERAGQASARKP